MSKRTAIYARVSSEGQARQDTIASQVEALRRYVGQQGWPLDPDDEYLDNGVSGLRLERPALERLRDAIAGGSLERVVVLSRDRLSRNFIHQEYLSEEWRKAGCQLHYVQEPQPSDTPEDLFSRRVRGILAEHERLVLLERTRRGRLHRAQQGEPPASPPWGYRYQPRRGGVGAHWTVEAEPAEWVRQIFRWIWQDHLAIREVARRLAQRSVVTPTGRARWSLSSLHGLLTNPAYRGETYARRFVHKPDRQTPGPWKAQRPVEEWIPIPVPALISPQEWEMTQEELTRRAQLAARHAQPRRYLLQGLLSCGQCGRRLAGRAQDQQLYYICRRKRMPFPADRCDSRYLRADEVEGRVWQAVQELILSPEQVLASYEAQRTAWLADESQQERQRLERESQTLQLRWQRMRSAYEHQAIELSELQEARQRKEQAEKDLSRRWQIWQENQHQWQGLAAALSELERYRGTLQASLEQLTFEQKREILTLLVEEVMIHEDKIVIRHILPTLTPNDTPLRSPHQVRSQGREKSLHPGLHRVGEGEEPPPQPSPLAEVRSQGREKSLHPTLVRWTALAGEGEETLAGIFIHYYAGGGMVEGVA